MKMDAGQQTAQSDMYYKQRGLGDDMSQFYNEQQYGARASQLNGLDRAREINRQRALQRQQFDIDRGKANADEVNGALDTAASFATTAGSMSDERAKRGIRGL
jgi:hypothetical protein